MNRPTYRFDIDPAVSLTESEMSLHLAMIALEGLFGRASVLMDARYHLDEKRREFVVDGSTPLGDSLVRVFAALLLREFGEGSFTVRRSLSPTAQPQPRKPNPASRATRAAAA